MNIKNGILNVPKHGNKHDLIDFVTTKLYVSYIWLFKASKAVERRLTASTLIEYYYFENSTGEISKISLVKLNLLKNITHPAESIM